MRSFLHVNLLSFVSGITGIIQDEGGIFVGSYMYMYIVETRLIAVLSIKRLFIATVASDQNWGGLNIQMQCKQKFKYMYKVLCDTNSYRLQLTESNTINRWKISDSMCFFYQQEG